MVAALAVFFQNYSKNPRPSLWIDVIVHHDRSDEASDTPQKTVCEMCPIMGYLDLLHMIGPPVA